jgi:hypothetical protein
MDEFSTAFTTINKWDIQYLDFYGQDKAASVVIENCRKLRVYRETGPILEPTSPGPLAMERLETNHGGLRSLYLRDSGSFSTQTLVSGRILRAVDNFKSLKCLIFDAPAIKYQGDTEQKIVSSRNNTSLAKLRFHRKNF